MPLFISYSHADKTFVDRLATQLVKAKVSVWLDRWELNLGDSLITKVQDAITDSSALLVILSKSSVESEWCKRELTSGLLRELEERRVVVMPVLMEDCEIPLFLRDKLYADFRTNFDDGWRTVLEGVSKVTNEWMNRIEEPNYHTDWAIDWGDFMGERAALRLTLVDHTLKQPYTVLTEVDIIGDEDATQWVNVMTENGVQDKAHRQIVTALSEHLSGIELRQVLDDQMPEVESVAFMMEYGGFVARVATRRLGTDTGRLILMNVSQQIANIAKQMNSAAYHPQN